MKDFNDITADFAFIDLKAFGHNHSP